MTRFFSFILQWRLATLAALGLITVGFTSQIPRGRLATDISEMFLEDPSTVDRYKHTVREFGSDEIILVAFDAGDVFTAAGLARLQAAVEELEALADIDRALAVVTADQIKGTRDTLLVRPYVDTMEDTPAWMESFRSELSAHPLYRDILISRDGDTVAVLLELTVDDARPGEALPALCADIEAILDKHNVGSGGRHQLGFPVSVAETIRESQFNMGRVFPLALVTVFFVGWLLFRALWPTLLTLGVALLAVSWVVGFAVILSPDINILVTVTPVVILVLSFADVVHLTNTYLRIVTDGVPKEEAILRTAQEVGPACLFTSLTTGLGFGSFAAVPAVVMRHFAVLMAFGTAGALLIAVTLVPVLFTLFPAPKPRRTGLSASHGSLLDRGLSACERATRRHPRLIAAAALAVTAATAYGASRLTVEVDFVHRFHASHPVRVADAFVRARMANANTAEVIIETRERDGAYDPAVLRAVAELQRRVLALPGVDSALTLTDLVALIHQEMNPGEIEPGELPDTRELVAQYILLYALGGEDDLGRFVNFDRNRIRMAVRLHENGMKDTFQVAQAIRSIAEETLPQGVTASVTGLMVMFGAVLQHIIRWQVTGLITAAITITGTFVLAFRSVRVALGGMIANFLPLLVFFGTIRWFDTHFDSDYIVIACVGLGIAVDDSIHFLSRYRLELGRVGGDMDAAIRGTVDHVGKPIVQTTLIIVLGFAGFNFCGYATARAFGAMLGSTLLWALLADLLLLPVLIRAGLIPMPFRTPATPGP